MTEFPCVILEDSAFAFTSEFGRGPFPDLTLNWNYGVLGTYQSHEKYRLDALQPHTPYDIRLLIKGARDLFDRIQSE